MTQQGTGQRAKVEPRAAIRSAAKVAFEIFQALIDEGFTRAEAKEIVADVLAKAVK